MDITSIIFGLALAGLSIAFINRPFRQKMVRGQKRLEGGEKLQTRKAAVLAALRDLDFDFKTGKVIDEDYSPVRTQLLAEAARLTQQEQAEEDQLEALIQDRRKRQKRQQCEKCGAGIEAGQHFCSNCGAPAENGACPFCGGRIKDRDVFCSACGKPLELKADAVGQA